MGNVGAKATYPLPPSQSNRAPNWTMHVKKPPLGLKHGGCLGKPHIYFGPSASLSHLESPQDQSPGPARTPGPSGPPWLFVARAGTGPRIGPGPPTFGGLRGTFDFGGPLTWRQAVRTAPNLNYSESPFKFGPTRIACCCLCCDLRHPEARAAGGPAGGGRLSRPPRARPAG